MISIMHWLNFPWERLKHNKLNSKQWVFTLFILNINSCVDFWHVCLSCFCKMCGRSTCGKNIADLPHRLICVDPIHDLWGKWLHIFHIFFPSVYVYFHCDSSNPSREYKLHCNPPRHMHEPFAVRVELINSLYFQKKIVEQFSPFSASDTYSLIN